MEMIIAGGLIILIGCIALSFRKVRELAEKYWIWIVLLLIAYFVSKYIVNH